MRISPKSGCRGGSEVAGFRPMVSLSPGEKHTLVLIFICHQNKEIAAALGIQESTAARRVQELLRDLRLQSRAQLMAWAAQRPEVFDPETEWVPMELHPLGCDCGGPYCASASKGMSLLVSDDRVAS